jgi:uncharacterized protein with PIN domain
VIYLDTSAYLAILFKEHNSAELTRFIRNKQLCSSSFMFLEAERNIVHYARQKMITKETFDEALDRLETDQAGFVLKDFSLDLALTRSYPTVTTPKSADLIHIRTAIWFMQHKSLYKFLTLDKNQKTAAKEMGLLV